MSLGAAVRVAPAALTLVCGCAGPASREFAVTVIDAAEIECTGTSISEALEPETLEGIANDIERAWEEQRALDPPTHEGRILRVNETEHAMRAWFDPHPGSDPLVQPLRFDNPLAVYAGGAHESYIEGSYADVFNTDEVDEEAGMEPCGDRARVDGVLSATDAKGIAGRIRWQEHTYIGSVTSACAGHVICVRDVHIDGLETEP
jgi:hypothetical protein